MGKYEPQRRKNSGSRKNILGGLALSALSYIGLQLVPDSTLASFSEKISRPRLDTIVQSYAPTEESPAVLTETVQGTMPIADGRYVQLQSVRPEALEEELDALRQHGLEIIVEPVKQGEWQRMLVRYQTDAEKRDIIREFKSVRPSREPMLLSKEGGVDRFERYTPQVLNSLEAYCKSANGKLENMPYYPEVHRTAELLIKENGLGQYGSKREIEKAIYAIIWTESALKEDAVSKAGAVGLMQVMPYMAKRIDPGLAEDLFHPENNILIGGQLWSEHVHTVARKTGLTDISEILPTSGAGYNAGTRHLLKVLDGNRPYKETRGWMTKTEQNQRIIDNYFPG